MLRITSLFYEKRVSLWSLEGSRRRPRATGWDPAGVRVSYNEGMRKRRWWFAGLTLALLAACVGVWSWPDPPQPELLKGMRPARVELAGDEYIEWYQLPTSIERFEQRSRKQLLEDGWDLMERHEVSRNGPFAFIRYSRTNDEIVFKTKDPKNGGNFAPLKLGGTIDLIRVTRKASVSDRFRLWFRNVPKP